MARGHAAAPWYVASPALSTRYSTKWTFAIGPSVSSHPLIKSQTPAVIQDSSCHSGLWLSLRTLLWLRTPLLPTSPPHAGALPRPH